MQKWTLFGSVNKKLYRPVFGPFTLSDVLKLCKLLNVRKMYKLESYFNTNSIRGRNLSVTLGAAPYLPCLKGS